MAKIPPVRVIAPWSEEQVALLNESQHCGLVHPYTCGSRDLHPENGGILIATASGWVCPVKECDYSQNWAWEPSLTIHAAVAALHALLRLEGADHDHHHEESKARWIVSSGTE